MLVSNLLALAGVAGGTVAVAELTGNVWWGLLVLSAVLLAAAFVAHLYASTGGPDGRADAPES